MCYNLYGDNMKLFRFLFALVLLFLFIYFGIKIYENTHKNEVEEYTIKDNLVISGLETSLDTVSKEEVDEDFKNSCKATFINVVDFIFYDGKINGVTFNELSDKGKEKVLKLANEIDTKIEEKVPNYKDTISDNTKNAYKEASNIIKKGSNSLDTFMKEKLSEESYNAIIDAKDDLIYYTNNAISYIKENGGKVVNEIKDRFSNWFKELKNN